MWEEIIGRNAKTVKGSMMDATKDPFVFYNPYPDVKRNGSSQEGVLVHPRDMLGWCTLQIVLQVGALQLTSLSP